MQPALYMEDLSRERPSLLSLIGSQQINTQQKQEEHAIILEGNGFANGRNNHSKASKESNGVDGKGALGCLPSRLKRKLVDAESALQEYIHSSERWDYSNHDNGHIEKQAKVSDTPSADHNLSRLYERIPSNASQAFMDQFDNVGINEITAMDWNVLKVLIRSLTISLKSHPSILTKSIQAERLDVLCYMLQYTPDLSESDAILILCISASSSDESMQSLAIVDGEIEWIVEEASARSTSGKRRKSKTADVSTKAVGQRSRWCRSHLALLHLMCTCVLRRRAAYSRSSLCGALTALSSSSAALLLRTFTYMMRGLSFPTEPSSETDNSDWDFSVSVFGETEAVRAIEWAEALLDAHFSSIVLRLNTSDKTVFTAVSSAMTSVGSVSTAMESVSDLLGEWTHACRTSGAEVKPTNRPRGIYQIEKLVF